MYVTVNVTVDVLCTCLLLNCYVTVYVPDYVTVIRFLDSGTNEGSIPWSFRGRPPSLVPTMQSKIFLTGLNGFVCTEEKWK